MSTLGESQDVENLRETTAAPSGVAAPPEKGSEGAILARFPWLLTVGPVSCGTLRPTTSGAQRTLAPHCPHSGRSSGPHLCGVLHRLYLGAL